jgi:hypothetical protein
MTHVVFQLKGFSMLRSQSMLSFNYLRKCAFASGLTAFSILASCHRDSNNDDGGTAVTNLSLADSNEIKAVFKFPNSQIQRLETPASHALHGTAIALYPETYYEDISITMQEGFGIVDGVTTRQLKLDAPLSAAGPAILVTTSETIGNRKPFDLSIPINADMQQPTGSSMVVVYRNWNYDMAASTRTGFIVDRNLLDRDGNKVLFRAPHAGLYQAAWYSGDQSKVIEVANAGPIMAADEVSRFTPGAFTLRTPMGQVIGSSQVASWSPSAQAEFYTIKIATSQDCENVVRSLEGVSTTTRNLENLNVGSYFLCVEAVSSRGLTTKAQNNGLPFSVYAGTLPAFTFSGQRQFNQSTITLAWTPSDGATFYNVTLGAQKNCSQPVDTASVKTNSWTTKPLADGTYYLCVEAGDYNFRKKLMEPDAGHFANEGIMIAVDATPPQTFAVIGIGGPQKAIRWSPSAQASFYNISVSEESGCTNPVFKRDRVSPSLVNMTVPGLTDGHKYYVCLSAFDDFGNRRDASTMATAFLYDITAPVVQKVSGTLASGVYPIGTTMDFQVTFSEPVLNINGSSATLALNASNRPINVIGGIGTAVWTFRYVVQEGDQANILNYSSESALTFTAGSLTDGAGNVFISRLPAVDSENSLANLKIKVDGVRPVVSTTNPSDGHTDVLSTIAPSMQFSEQVDPQSVGDFALVKKSDSSNVSSNFTVKTGTDGQSLTFTPKTGTTLTAKTVYELTVRNVKDVAGNKMNDKTISFTTK